MSAVISSPPVVAARNAPPRPAGTPGIPARRSPCLRTRRSRVERPAGDAGCWSTPDRSGKGRPGVDVPRGHLVELAVATLATALETAEALAPGTGIDLETAKAAARRPRS